MRPGSPFARLCLPISLLFGLIAGAAEAKLSPVVFTTEDGTRVEALRGDLEVPEERGVPGANTLKLTWYQLPSTAAKKGAPLIYLAGGPGASGIDSARGPRAALLLALREAGDVILLDQRGTGLSRPGLVCGNSWEHAKEQKLEQATAIAAIEAAARVCAEQMGRRKVNLQAYNVREIADDIEDLRRALGVPKVSLVATSFGTRLALEVLRRHGASIDRCLLLGVVGPDQELKLPAEADEVLGRLDLGDGTSLRDSLRARLAELTAQPVEATAFDLLTGKEVVVGIGPFDLQMVIADHLGATERLLLLRELAMDLERGEWSPLAQALLRQRKRWLGSVVSYAITCTTGASPERAALAAQQAATAVVGRQLDFAFPEVCQALGIGPLDSSIREKVISEVPVLAISGTFDARTPVGNAERVLAGLRRGAHLIVEGAGHGDDLMVSTPEIAQRAVHFLQGQPENGGRIRALPNTERSWRAPATLADAKVVDQLFDVEVRDPYRWLEEDRTPEARIWIDQQNGHTDRLLARLPGRREMRQELRELTRGGGVGLPLVRGGRLLYRATRADTQLPALFLRDENGQERQLIDPASLESPGQSVAIEQLDLSLDGKKVAFSVRRNGSELFSVRFLWTENSKLLDDELPAGRYFGVSIAPNGEGVYYGRERDDGEGSRLHYHRFGSTAPDPILFGEAYGRASIVWGNLSDDGRWLVHHGVSGTRRQIDVFLDRVDSPGTAPPPPGGHDIGTRQEVVSGINAPFYVGVQGETLVIHTTWEAPRGRVFVAPVTAPGRANWKEIVPQHPTAVIQKVYGAGGRLIVEYLDNIQSRLHVFDLAGKDLGEVKLPAAGTIGGLSGDFAQPLLYFSFSSFHLPGAVYRLDLDSGKLEPWPAKAHRGGADGWTIAQKWATSADGTKIPFFVIHRPGLELNGSNATLINAYGGFGTSLTPSYQPQAAWWVEKGGVFVVANVRGGGELGEQWHQAAVRQHKQRSIDDLIAVAQELIAAGYTRPNKLATWGHSNGGLLVAAAMVQRPELFRAVISTHALLDMVRYNRFLAARFWLPEFGSPERADAFPHLRAYSPYHNVVPGTAYPAVYLETSYADDQVSPMHARKMAAALQAASSSKAPVLLRHHRKTGHGGQGVSLEQRVDELVDVLSFLTWQLGLR